MWAAILKVLAFVLDALPDVVRDMLASKKAKREKLIELEKDFNDACDSGDPDRINAARHRMRDL